MAKIFSDENGNIGTIIVLKGQPQDYLPETHTYHGEHEILDTHIVEALVVNNGVLEHDETKLKAYKVAQAEARYEMCRAHVKEELHDALLDGATDAELQVIKDKITTLKDQRDTVINDINGHIQIGDIYDVDITVITHVGI